MLKLIVTLRHPSDENIHQGSIKLLVHPKRQINPPLGPFYQLYTWTNPIYNVRQDQIKKASYVIGTT